jgi:hypothetical protein
MKTQLLAAFLGVALVGPPRLGGPQAAAPERVRIAFAPPKGSGYVLAYDKDEKWDYGDRSGEQHVHWTMRDRIATVTKKGRVFIDGEFQSVEYRSAYVVSGKPEQRAFQWTLDGGYAGDVGKAIEEIGKKEIPKGLHLILDARGAAEHGEC